MTKRIKIVNDDKGLLKIWKKLQAVFPAGELNALFAKARNDPMVHRRQYLYRARKRYSYFEELFGIRIEI